MALTFGSLFAGIGGLDLGLERAGMICKWQVEIDDYATRVLERHWPGVRRWRDITTFPPLADAWCHKCRSSGCDQAGTSANERQTETEEDWRRVPDKPRGGCTCGWHCDLICAGFPCQDISYAGRGAGISGERSGLFYEVARIVGLLGPRYVLLENVAALLTRGLGEVLGTLASLGYDAEWHCVPAAAVGAPHIRDRVFIIGYLPETLRDELGLWGIRKGHPTECGVPNSPQRGQPELRWSQREGGFPDGCGEDVADARCVFAQMAAQRKFSTEQILKQSSWWAVEPDVGRVAHGIPSRVERLRCLGNAVVPQVAEFIGRMIVGFYDTHEAARAAGGGDE